MNNKGHDMKYKGYELEIREDGWMFYIRYRKSGKWLYGWSGVYVPRNMKEDEGEKEDCQVMDCRSILVKKFKEKLNRKV